MYIPITTLTILSVLSYGLCDSSEELSDNSPSKLRSSLSADSAVKSILPYYEEYCPGTSEQLKQAIDYFQKCDDGVDTSLVTICSAVQDYTLNCTKPILDVLDNCLPMASRGFPSFIAKSAISAFDYLCKQSGESIIELINPCMWKESKESQEKLDICEAKVEKWIKEYQKKLPTVQEICSLTGVIRGCVKEQVSGGCKNPKTKNSILGLFDAFVVPCATIVNNVV